MGAISLRHITHANNTHHRHKVITEEIEGLIRVHRDGHVERPPIVPTASCSVASEHGVTAKDVIIKRHQFMGTSIYSDIPLLVFFHGGGFCVGSASWSCYHEFLANLASKANCTIISVNYHLAPENRLPAAYDNAFNTLLWVEQEALHSSSGHKWWLSHCNLSYLFLAGDSAGANIAYNVATRLGIRSNTSFAPTILNPLLLKGIILIQPFFGGEARTSSERHSNQPPNSALTPSASDTYWRLALPLGANRDHPNYNPPLAHGSVKLRDLWLPTIMVYVSEMDIMKDTNLEFSNSLAKAGKRVETVMYKKVCHAFQVLHNSQLSQSRTQDLMSYIEAFLTQ